MLKSELEQKISELEKEIVLLKGKEDIKNSHFNPSKNSKAISIIQQEDGNWMAWMQKHGRVIESREGKPEDALLRLIVHE